MAHVDLRQEVGMLAYAAEKRVDGLLQPLYYFSDEVEAAGGGKHWVAGMVMPLAQCTLAQMLTPSSAPG